MTSVPLWKSALLILVVGFGVVVALPNLYAPDPSIQITGNSRAAEVDEGLRIASEALTAAGESGAVGSLQPGNRGSRGIA